MTTGRLKSKPEIEFQYSDRSFSQTGSSYNSTVDWDIFTKFGIHLEILIFYGQPHYQTGTRRSLATSTDAILKVRWSHNYASDGPIHMKFGTPT